MSMTGVRAALLKLSHCAIPARRRIGPLEDETAIEPRPHAGAIVVSSSGENVISGCLNDLKSLISKEDFNILKNSDELYILFPVEPNFKPLAGEIKDEETRKEVVEKLSNKKTATIEINDLHKLDGFLGLSWKDIHKKLRNIKKGLKLILYIEQKGQLREAIIYLHLDHIYKFDTAEERWRMLKVANFAH